MEIELGGIQTLRQWVDYRTWAKFHEQTHRASASGAAGEPHHYIIFSWVLSALEEVEEHVLGAIAHVKIATVGIRGRLAESFGQLLDTKAVGRF